MPLAGAHYTDAVVRPFLWGLLPDNDEVLRRWGQRFHVSPRNPFRLLAHVGEECAGAVQFLRPERVEEWLQGTAPGGINWLDEKELEQRIRELVADHAGSRRVGDEGPFSLADAQPKTGLYPLRPFLLPALSTGDTSPESEAGDEDRGQLSALRNRALCMGKIRPGVEARSG